MNAAEYSDALANIIPNSDLRDRVIGLTVCLMADLKQDFYVVTAVDTSESADGKARVLGLFKSEAEAKAYVRNDIEAYVDDSAGMELICDFDAMSARTKDYSYGCEWNIEKVNA